MTYVESECYNSVKKWVISVAVSKAQQKAVRKYINNHYDRLEITVPKGQKDLIKDIAEKNGYSINGFVNKAIEEQIKKMEQE